MSAMMVTIDGSLGEGGGQILSGDGQAFLHRTHSSKKGKAGTFATASHCVHAAAEICRARVEGSFYGYYHRPDQKLRLFFANDRISAIYVTRSDY